MTAFLGHASVYFVVALSLFLLASSVRARVPGTRIGRFSLVAVLGGSIFLAVVLVVYGDRMLLVWRAAFDGTLTPYFPALGIALLGGATVIALLLGELAVVVFPERVGAWSARGRNRRSDLLVDLTSGVLVLVLMSAPLAWATMTGDAVPGGAGSGFDHSILADFELPGPPMDYEAIDNQTGYLTVATGEIYSIHFGPDLDQVPDIRLVADDLVFPRGVAVVGNTLFVGDTGQLACDDSFPTCFGETAENEGRIIEASSGSIIAYEIQGDLSLSDRRVAVGNIPIAGSEHAINDVEVGPDGAIYASIGGVDWLWETPEAIADIDHPNIELLGTIIRIDPDTFEYTIHASGMRNVYGFDFDANGHIIAVDNSGWTTHGWYPEAILSLRQGDDFGYPWGPGAVTRAGASPIWQLTHGGTAAVEWLDSGPWSPGLLMGRHDLVTLVKMGVGDDAVFVEEGDATMDVLDSSGYVTVIEQLDNGRILTASSGIYGGEPSRLQIVDPG